MRVRRRGHLPGMTASKTVCRCWGAGGIEGAEGTRLSAFDCADPGGISGGDAGNGKAGAINAALLAAAMLGAKHTEIREALREFRRADKESFGTPESGEGADRICAQEE